VTKKNKISSSYHVTQTAGLIELMCHFFQVAAVLARNVLAARADFEQHSEEDFEAGDADLSGAEEFVLDDPLADVSQLQHVDDAAAKHPSVKM
jgi:hypothetical protein